MSAIGIMSFGRTIEKTNVWFTDLMAELGWDEPERSYHALRAVLHALRDRLSVQEAAELGATAADGEHFAAGAAAFLAEGRSGATAACS